MIRKIGNRLSWKRFHGRPSFDFAYELLIIYTEIRWNKPSFDDQTYSLFQLGLEPYNGVGIIGFNSPEWVIADLGAIYAWYVWHYEFVFSVVLKSLELRQCIVLRCHLASISQTVNANGIFVHCSVRFRYLF